MKVRIYYNGYKDQYFPQYRWYGLWRSFLETHRIDYHIWKAPAWCPTVEEAKNWLVDERNRIIEERKQKALLKKRDEKSGVVFEETWDI